jgi:hypothetical protein
MIPDSIQKLSAALAEDERALSSLQSMEDETSFVSALMAFAAEHGISISANDLTLCKQTLLNRWLLRMV